MSLKLKKAEEKVKKNKLKTELFYTDYFEQLNIELKNGNLDDEQFKVNYMFNVMRMWDEFCDGEAPVSPTKSDVCMVCPAMVLVSGIFNKHISDDLGEGENLDTLYALFDSINEKFRNIH